MYIYLMLGLENDELLFRLALSKVEGIGAIRARSLLRHFGSAKTIFSLGVKSLRGVEGLGEKGMRALLQPVDFKPIEQELLFIEKNNVQVLFIDQPGYPKRLKHCPDAPITLFFKGNDNLQCDRVVAVIGTRKNTHAGQSLTEDLIATLSNQGVLVVSGLAFGIDAWAHRAALNNGLQTVGVLAHGLDRIYPSAHESLARRMVAQGGLLSEYPSGTIPDKQNFPKRNRIVAGMADVTVVVETRERGGAMITANLALDYNREVAAFPGRPTDVMSSGCNELIRTNKAHLITSGGDLLALMNWDVDKTPKVKQQKLFVQLSEAQQSVAQVLEGAEALHLDELSARLPMGSSALASVLLSLELEGLVRSLPGRRYQLS